KRETRTTVRVFCLLRNSRVQVAAQVELDRRGSACRHVPRPRELEPARATAGGTERAAGDTALRARFERRIGSRRKVDQWLIEPESASNDRTPTPDAHDENCGQRSGSTGCYTPSSPHKTLPNCWVAHLSQTFTYP